MIIMSWYFLLFFLPFSPAFSHSFLAFWGSYEPLTLLLNPYSIKPFQAFFLPLFQYKKGWDSCSHPLYSCFSSCLCTHVFHRHIRTLFWLWQGFIMDVTSLFWGYTFRVSSVTISTCVECGNISTGWISCVW